MRLDSIDIRATPRTIHRNRGVTLIRSLAWIIEGPLVFFLSWEAKCVRLGVQHCFHLRDALLLTSLKVGDTGHYVVHVDPYVSSRSLIEASNSVANLSDWTMPRCR